MKYFVSVAGSAPRVFDIKTDAAAYIEERLAGTHTAKTAIKVWAAQELDWNVQQKVVIK